MQGNLQDMAVADLIQHNCQQRKSVQLLIQHADQQVFLYFKDGNVVHAVSNESEGEEVVYQILDWEEGTFNLETGVDPPEITITRRWPSLLMECARRSDENKHDSDLFESYRILDGKDVKMNIKRLNKVVEDLKEDLGSALIATDNWNTADATSLAGYNSQPKAIALFNEITRHLKKTLTESSFPGLGQYYMIHLENNYMVVVVVQGNFQEGMLVDLSKTTLGLLLNIALPRVMEGLAEAIK